MKRILNVSGVSKSYGFASKTTNALNNVNLEIYRGEMVGIMGPSGAGKSTLLNVVSTIDKPTEGIIEVNQVKVNKMKRRDLADFRARNLGFIFQDYNLLDTLTIGENIALPLTIAGHAHNKVVDLVNEKALQLGIETLLDKFPFQCSGGEKQRAAAVRAMIHNPSLILADEPTGALDSKSSQALLSTLHKMKTELTASIMMVTHDPLVASHCDRVYFIQDGQIFNQLIKEKGEERFFDRIQDVVTIMGGKNEPLF
ncbi:ABC transporter ATP-binding protein [Fusibacter sp. JL216-2]|uniref:ABC transporter ATP-binding protein n=1 Tax=Fusibacter sp. JL216-2 TaxID=3071453 RepID=UPI003D35514B